MKAANANKLNKLIKKAGPGSRAEVFCGNSAEEDAEEKTQCSTLRAASVINTDHRDMTKYHERSFVLNILFKERLKK